MFSTACNEEFYHLIVPLTLTGKDTLWKIDPSYPVAIYMLNQPYPEAVHSLRMRLVMKASRTKMPPEVPQLL